MRLVKLTTSAAKSTYGDVLWAPGTTVSIPEDERGTLLARLGLFHVYPGNTVDEALALGLMMDPVHARIGDGARAFEVRGEIVAQRPDLAGAHVLEVGDELQVSLLTLEQRVHFGILCTQSAIGEQCPVWNRWAERWLCGEDRSTEAAETAAWEAWEAWEAAEAAARAAVRAAVVLTAWGAGAAAEAAEAAEAAVLTALKFGTNINLGALALRAIREENTPQEAHAVDRGHRAAAEG